MLLLNLSLFSAVAGSLAASNLAYGFSAAVTSLVLAWAAIWARSSLSAVWRLLRSRRYYLRWLLLIGVGFGAAWLWSEWRLSALPSALPEAWEKQTISLSGRVSSLPRQYERSLGFTVEVEQAILDGEALELSAVELNWYQPGASLRLGDRISAQVRLSNYRNYANPGGFDFVSYKRAQDLQARGYVYCCLETIGGSLSWIERWRSGIADSIDAQDGLRHAGLIKALLIGERSQIAEDTRRIMRNTAVAHLLAISGLHIGLVFAFTWLLARNLLKLLMIFNYQRTTYGYSLLLALVAAWVYAFLSGWQLPAQRAVLMLSAVVLSLYYFPRASSLSAWLLAMVVVLALDPLAWSAPGFWLSFIAVAILLAQAGGWNAPGNWRRRLWRRWLRPQLLVSLGLAPLVLLFWQKLSPWSIPLNLVLIPVVSLVVMPLLIAALLSLSITPLHDLLVQAADYGLAGIVWLLQLVDQLPPVYLLHNSSSAGAVAAVVLALGWLLLPLPIQRKWPAALILCLVLAPPQQQRPPVGEAWLQVLDSGQGLAVFIQTAEHGLLYDTGPNRALLIDYLYHRGQSQLSELILSHSDFDHSGSAEYLLKQMPVTQTRANFALARPDWQSTQSQPCTRGQSFSYDGVLFQVLHPDHRHLSRDANRNSCVLRLSANGHSVLLTGDIDSVVESELLRNHAGLLSADALVAPHHGSNSSSSAAFIAAVNPSKVIFSAGYKNSYGHPHPAVVQRYRDHGSSIYTTSNTGAIGLRLRSSGLELSAERGVGE